MKSEQRYTLESRRVTHRRQKKGTCPQCGERSLVRYVDLKNDCCYLSDEVGRCDHENSCGYHYRPRDYFRDHPDRRTAAPATPRDSLVGHASQRDSIASHAIPADARSLSQRDKSPFAPPEEQPLIPQDPLLALRSHSPRSTFWQWVTATAPMLGASVDDLRRVYDDYCIGATRQGDVIFWQIDEHGLVHTGHIMAYNRQGHRQGYQSWTHFRLQCQGLLPLDYQPPKCFFGQHLLAWQAREGRQPVAAGGQTAPGGAGASAVRQPVTGQAGGGVGPAPTICIVESEKTAVLMALMQPDFLWLATAGCGGLSVEKTACLKGRRVLLFPDSGCYDKWSRQMAQTTGIDYTVSPCLETYPPNTDIADLLLESLGEGVP